MKIKHVVLQSSNLQETLTFYKEMLNLTVLEENQQQFTLQIGESKLTFEHTNNGNPCYHFAFDVPKQLFQNVKSWLSQYATLNIEDQQDEIYFNHLDAHSIYCYDPSGNIVEFIGRHETTDINFSSKCISRISEMSLVVHDVQQASHQLMTEGIKERDNEILIDALNFMCTGEDKVYLLLVKEGRKWLFSDKVSTVYPIEITTEQHQINISNAQLTVQSVI